MDEMNPYAPPKSDDAPPGPAEATEIPAYKLYTPAQVTLATFLGTPIAGMYLLSTNRRRMGHAGQATTTLLGGVGVTVLLIVLAIVLPESVGRAVPLVTTIAVSQYARIDQPLLDAHLARRGQKESSWKAAGFGLAGMVALLAILFAVILIVDPS